MAVLQKEEGGRTVTLTICFLIGFIIGLIITLNQSNHT